MGFQPPGKFHLPPAEMESSCGLSRALFPDHLNLPGSPRIFAAAVETTQFLSTISNRPAPRNEHQEEICAMLDVD
jgi:hypothetical protein